MDADAIAVVPVEATTYRPKALTRMIGARRERRCVLCLKWYPSTDMNFYRHTNGKFFSRCKKCYDSIDVARKMQNKLRRTHDVCAKCMTWKETGSCAPHCPEEISHE